MKYSVKNFRVFDNNGVTVDLAPITILTGCNSSGKSSIAKSLLLLDSYFTNGRIDFTKRPYSLLGDFDKVLNRKSEDGMITIEYSTYSVAYDGEITVRLKFGRDEEDDLHNAFLQEICLLDSDGYTLYQSLCGKDGYYMDRACLKGLKERFFNFISDNDLDFLSVSYCTDPLYESSCLDVSSELRNGINELRQGKGNAAFKKARELQSLYVLNIFDWLNDCTCENIENTIYSHINSDSINNYEGVSTGIKMLVEDFRRSQCETFIEYFDRKESCRKFYQKDTNNQEVICHPHNSVNLRTNFDIKYELPCPFIDSENSKAYIDYMDEFTEKDSTKLDFVLSHWDTRYCTFEQLFSLLMTLESLTRTESSISYTHSYSILHYVPEFDKDVIEKRESSRILKVFDLYLALLLKEGIAPNFKGISYVSSSRASVQRMYTLEENNDFALLLRQYFEAKRNFKPQETPYHLDSSELGAEGYNEPNAFLNKWLRQFGIAHHIAIVKAKEGGVCIYLYSDENDREGELLADKGYGITQLVSILLQIEMTIMSSKWEVPGLYGKNQEVGRHMQLIAIEEPEIHLHPKFQSLLADMFLEAYHKYNIHFIIETHSEYLIRKFQTEVAKSKVHSKSISIVYVDHPDVSQRAIYAPQVYNIVIKNNGMLSRPFGAGFFDEADNLAMELLTLRVAEDDKA